MSNIISAFSAEQAERLTGLSSAQLREWDAAGFFQPSYAAENRRSPYSRVYSFEDLVGLRVLSILRNTHRVSLQHLKAVARKLAQYAPQPWSELTLYVLNKEVHFRNPSDGLVQGAVSGQLAVPVPISSVVEDVKARAEKLRERDKDTVGQVERHRFVVHNEAVVAGTRIPLSTLRSFADAGYSVEEILREYPSLAREDVETALSTTVGLTHAA
jgi:uncharacterized protein (DUF433 family)